MTDVISESALADLGSVNTRAIEATQRRLTSRIQGATQGQQLRLDLSTVNHGGAAFVGMLVRVMKLARRNGVNVQFTGIQPRVHEVLAICRLTEVLPLK